MSDLRFLYKCTTFHDTNDRQTAMSAILSHHGRRLLGLRHDSCPLLGYAMHLMGEEIPSHRTLFLPYDLTT